MVVLVVLSAWLWWVATEDAAYEMSAAALVAALAALILGGVHMVANRRRGWLAATGVSFLLAIGLTALFAQGAYDVLTPLPWAMAALAAALTYALVAGPAK